MIDRQTAREIARRYLAEEYMSDGLVFDTSDDLILGPEILDEDGCWVFFYNTRAFYESGELSECLVGNGPLLVDKQTGVLREVGTAHPVEHYLLREPEEYGYYDDDDDDDLE
jgi:Immunity protein 35